MKTLAISLSLLLITVIAGEALAKRIGPKPVAPVVHDGVKYVAPNDNGREGRIEARSEKSGEKLWGAVVYKVEIDPNLEEDVQWVFITGIELRDDKLVITNEKNQRFVLDLATQKIEKGK